MRNRIFDSQNVLVKKASAVEKEEAAHHRVLASHS